MDSTTLASVAMLMKTSQTQQVMATTLIKQAATQQNMLSNLLAQSIRTAPQPASATGYGFSTYA